MNKLKSNKLADLILLLLVLYIFQLPNFISLLLNKNFGFAELQYKVEVTLALPVAFFLIMAVFKRQLKLPYIREFLAVELFFVFFESEFFRPGNVPVLTYPYSLLILYCVFVALVNYGRKIEKVEKIISYSVAAVTFLAVTVMLGYMGVLEISMETGDFFLNELASSRPVGNIIHTNGCSLACCAAIFLLLIGQTHEQTRKRSNKTVLLLVIFLLSLIIINSSMGAFLIVCAGLGTYLIRTRDTRHPYVNFVILYAILIFSLAWLFPTDIPFLEKFYIYNRVSEEGQFISRFRQVYVTWVNFVENPWFGVGYFNAARGVLPGYTRSNFHYTQILATNGIFYFVMFAYFLIKMFGINFRKLTSFLCMVIGLATFMFYNWTSLFPLAIFAYLVYFEKEQAELVPESAETRPELALYAG